MELSSIKGRNFAGSSQINQISSLSARASRKLQVEPKLLYLSENGALIHWKSSYGLHQSSALWNIVDFEHHEELQLEKLEISVARTVDWSNLVSLLHIAVDSLLMRLLLATKSLTRSETSVRTARTFIFRLKLDSERLCCIVCKLTSFSVSTSELCKIFQVSNQPIPSQIKQDVQSKHPKRFSQILIGKSRAFNLETSKKSTKSSD